MQSWHWRLQSFDNRLCPHAVEAFPLDERKHQQGFEVSHEDQRQLWLKVSSHDQRGETSSLVNFWETRLWKALWIMSSIIRRVNNEKIIASSCLPRGVNVYATYIIEWCHGFAITSHVSSMKRISHLKSLTNVLPKTWKMRSSGMSRNHTYTH